MGTALTGNTISSSYLGLIKTTDSAAISGSAKVLTDGAGNDSPLYLSTSRLGIGITPTSTLHVSGDFTLTGAFKDTSGDTGTSGQILSSTATGTNWIDNDTGDITSVVAGDGLTGGGTSGAVTINAGAGNLIDVQADQIDVDLSELATSTSDADGDFFAVIDDANAQKKLTKGNINLSGFNNDLSIPTVSGTTNKIAKFTASTTVGDSVITEVSSEIGINIASPQEILHQHIGSTSTNYHQFTNSTTGSAVNNGLLVGINSAGEAQILNKLNSANAKIRLATYAGTTIMDLNGNIEADNGSNGDQYLRVSNNDSGTAAEATIYVSNSGTNSDGLFAGALGTSFTTASGFVQDGVAIGSGTGASGGLSIMTRAAADMRFYTNGHTNERMRIESGGNIGVGTSTINRQLVLKDDTLACLQLANATTGVATNDGVQIQLASSTGYIGNYDGDLVFFNTSSGTERMTIESDGDININGGSITIERSTTNAEAGIIDFGSGGFEFTADAAGTGYPITFNGGTSGSVGELMRIDSSGNVLVGATGSDIGGSNTGVKFTQNGTISASDDATGDTSTVTYLDRRGTNNEGKVLMFGMGGFLKAGIGVVGTSANTNDGGITFETIGTNPATYDERMRIAQDGNLGINITPSASVKLLIKGGTTDSTTTAIQANDSSNADLFYVKNDGTSFFKSKMGIGTANTTYSLQVYGNLATFGTVLQNASATGNGLLVDSTNGTNSYVAGGFRTNVGVYKCVIYGNGDIANVNNSYGTYSDIKLKENIKDATSKLEDICKLKVRNFDLKETKEKQIGFVAQELEDVFPSLVYETDDTQDNEDGSIEKTGEKTKAIKSSVLVPILVKAVQELKAEIDELKKK